MPARSRQDSARLARRHGSAVLCSVALAAGCFGEGPVPTAPSEATILYVAEAGEGCNISRYIGDVAIGAGTEGYLVALPYVSQDCGGGGDVPQIAVSVERFQKARLSVEALGDLGNSTGLRPPRLAATGSSAMWLYSDSMTNTVLLGPSLGSIPTANGSMVPAGLVADDTSSFVALWSQQGGRAEVNNPNFPCCGPQPLNSDPMGSTLLQIPIAGGSATGLPVSPRFACEEIANCLVDNAATLFYVEHAEPLHDAAVSSFPKAGVAAQEAVVLGTVDAVGATQLAVVGLAASETHVAWSVSNVVTTQRPEDPPPPPTCAIHVYDLATRTESQLLATSAFSCTHAVIDNGSVYFAIVSIQNQRMHGDGIGRIAIADQGFESIALGIQGDGAGPRRIFIEGDSMYLVDPFVLASVRTRALDGKHDFTK